MKTVFLRAIEREDKARALREGAHRARNELVNVRFDVSLGDLAHIPRLPFAYWASPALIECYGRLPRFETDGRIARVTNPLADNFRFVRTSWELPAATVRKRQAQQWVPLCKGGSFRPYYDDPHLLVLWDYNRATYHGFIGTPHRPLAKPASVEHFFRPGLTWPIRTNGLSFRVMPPGCVFGSKGPAAFVEGDRREDLLALAAVSNSRPFLELLSLQLARTELAQSFEVGLVQMTPVPTLSREASDQLASLAERSWRLRCFLDSECETSHQFRVPALVQWRAMSFDEAVAEIVNGVLTTQTELKAIDHEVNGRCEKEYGLSGGRHVSPGTVAVADIADGASHDEDADDQDEADQAALDSAALAAGLVSWAVGAGVGRFDVQLATGEREWPEDPGPFDPLPVCSPGMLAGDHGLPLDAPPAGYPIQVSPVLVDDPGHGMDITARVRSVFDVVLGVRADEWWSDVGSALGGKRQDVSSWLSKGFFEHHLKAYSQSRRKAPIYWPLGTASGSYLVWLYAHRVTGDSLFRVLNDVVYPKLALERRGLSESTQEAGPNPSASQRNAIDTQETFVDELQDFVDELTAVAPLWHPDLNDGIVVVLAPLWRLFAHHKAWSKELRKHWDSLMAGECDWAQLAMRLWPERVVPKCAEDRSLAIAHALEEVFWVQDDENPDRWHPRESPTLAVEELIADRTDPAVKAALEGMDR